MAYSEAKAIKALERANAIIRRPGARGGRGNLGDLCKKYSSVRPMLQIALPLIGRLPIVGKKVVDAVQFLMGIADVACPM